MNFLERLFFKLQDREQTLLLFSLWIVLVVGFYKLAEGSLAVYSDWEATDKQIDFHNTFLSRKQAIDQALFDQKEQQKDKSYDKVNLINRSAYFATEKGINFGWHQDHESYFVNQTHQHYLNIYIPIKKSELGLNPQIDGQLIRLPVPELNEERRAELKKIIKSIGEKCKVSIRNIRREANEDLKKLLKSKEISEDEEKSHEKKIQIITDDHIKIVDEKVSSKEKEIMKI